MARKGTLRLVKVLERKLDESPKTVRVSKPNKNWLKKERQRARRKEWATVNDGRRNQPPPEMGRSKAKRKKMVAELGKSHYDPELIAAFDSILCDENVGFRLFKESLAAKDLDLMSLYGIRSEVQLFYLVAHGSGAFSPNEELFGPVASDYHIHLLNSLIALRLLRIRHRKLGRPLQSGFLVKRTSTGTSLCRMLGVKDEGR